VGNSPQLAENRASSVCRVIILACELLQACAGTQAARVVFARASWGLSLPPLPGMQSSHANATLTQCQPTIWAGCLRPAGASTATEWAALASSQRLFAFR
jgi:hypothetical protein